MRLNELEHRSRQLQAILSLLLAALLMALAIPSEAMASKYASMVIDANTGKTLQASSADEQRHPASLTKMMTLYMVFDEIGQGRLSLDSTIRMTKWGAMAPPSKLGLEEGEEITVRNAILALVTKSANDVARAVAEHIGGTEAGFARMMTEKARLLGMPKTTFRNASGLPDIEQVTTARDMLTLALHLQDHFPQHYHFFSTRAFKYRGRTYRNHNGLLRTYPGTDGIKTGYIRMSGFNVVTSVKRGNRHVVGVVFGGRTARSRNAEMSRLLNGTIQKASTRKTRNPEPASFYRVPPPIPARPPAPEKVASSAGPKPLMTASSAPPIPARSPEMAPQDSAASPTIAIAKVRHVSVAPAADPSDKQPEPVALRTTTAPAGLTGPTRVVLGRAPSTLQEQAESLPRGGEPALERLTFAHQAYAAPAAPEPVTQAIALPEGDKPRAVEVAARIPVSSPSAAGGYHVQVGAYTTLAEAKKALVATLEQASALLAESAPLTIPVKSGARQLFRARFAGFDSSAARNTCEALRQRQIDCFVAKAE